MNTSGDPPTQSASEQGADETPHSFSRFRISLEALNVRLGCRAYLVLTLLAVCFYLVSYLSHFGLPEVSARWPLGWWGWWDQGQYLESAGALAQFDLRRESHWYPLGYPALGAVLYSLIPIHPFLIPNLLCFVAILWLLNGIYRQFVSKTEAVILIALSVLWTSEVMENLVIPWNTIPTQPLTYTIIYLLVFGQPNARRYFAGGFLAGLMFSCRPGDVLFVGPVFAAAVCWERQPRRMGVALAAAFLGFLPAFGTMLVLNKSIFGAYLNTPYAQMQVETNGFSLVTLPVKALSLLVNAEAAYLTSDRMLLARFPWLLLVAPGAIWAIKRSGIRFLGVLVSIVTAFVFYLSFNDFGPANVFKFYLIHYLVWTLPLLALLAYLTIRDAWRRLPRCVTLGTIAIPAAILSIIAVEAEPVPWKGELVVIGGEASALPGGTVRFKKGEFCGVRVKLAERTRFDAVYIPYMPKVKRFEIQLDEQSLTPFHDFTVVLSVDSEQILLHREGFVDRFSIGFRARQDGSWSPTELVLRQLRFRLRPSLSWLFGAPSGVRAARIGQIRDVAARSPECGPPDGEPDEGVRLRLPAERADRIRYLELRSRGEPPAQWFSCSDPRAGWRMRITKKGSETTDLSGGGTFKLHVVDNGAFRSNAPLELIGWDPFRTDVFRVRVRE